MLPYICVSSEESGYSDRTLLRFRVASSAAAPGALCALCTALRHTGARAGCSRAPVAVVCRCVVYDEVSAIPCATPGTATAGPGASTQSLHRTLH